MKKGFFLFVFLVSNFAFATEIKSVNFIQDGEVSKLVIDLDGDTEAKRFHLKEDKQIILDLKNVNAGPKILRGIDTSEFSGSSAFISVYKKPGNPTDVRFAIQLRDNVRSTLDFAKNKVILNIENRFGVFSQAKVEASEKNVEEMKTETINQKINIPKSENISDILENLTLSGPKKYIGKNISINVHDLPVIDLLKMIADTSGFNIILDQDVQKSAPLTLSLSSVPWDQALDTVLQLSKLVARKNSNILLITTLDKATTEMKAQLEAERLNKAQEPVVTKIFPISFAATADLEIILKDYITKERGSLVSDVRTNSIIIKDTIEAIEKIRKIIETLDTQTPQVLIESKIVEASESFQKNMGLRNGIFFGYDPIAAIPATGIGPGFTFSSAPNTLTTGNGSGPTFLGLNVGVFRRVRNLGFTLNMMEFESKGKIISSPKIITQNKKAATIAVTDTTYYQTTNVSNGVVSGAFSAAAAPLNMNVTPQVTNDGSINLQVMISKTSFGGKISDNSPPDTLMSSVNTNVLVENGSTIVLGGLYKTSNTESHSGLPFLKNLPIIGWFFRTAYNPASTRSELIIFMTPRIINQEEAGLVDRTNEKGT